MGLILNYHLPMCVLFSIVPFWSYSGSSPSKGSQTWLLMRSLGELVSTLIPRHPTGLCFSWSEGRLRHLFLFFIEVSLIYNLIFVLSIQHSSSTVTHIIKSSPRLVQLLSVNIGRWYRIIGYILQDSCFLTSFPGDSNAAGLGMGVWVSKGLLTRKR